MSAGEIEGPGHPLQQPNGGTSFEISGPASTSSERTSRRRKYQRLRDELGPTDSPFAFQARTRHKSSHEAFVRHAIDTPEISEVVRDVVIMVEPTDWSNFRRWKTEDSPTRKKSTPATTRKRPSKSKYSSRKPSFALSIDLVEDLPTSTAPGDTQSPLPASTNVSSVEISRSAVGGPTSINNVPLCTDGCRGTALSPDLNPLAGCVATQLTCPQQLLKGPTTVNDDQGALPTSPNPPKRAERSPTKETIHKGAQGAPTGEQETSTSSPQLIEESSIAEYKLPTHPGDLGVPLKKESEDPPSTNSHEDVKIKSIPDEVLNAVVATAKGLLTLQDPHDECLRSEDSKKPLVPKDRKTWNPPEDSYPGISEKPINAKDFPLTQRDATVPTKASKTVGSRETTSRNGSECDSPKPRLRIRLKSPNVKKGNDLARLNKRANLSHVLLGTAPKTSSLQEEVLEDEMPINWEPFLPDARLTYEETEIATLMEECKYAQRGKLDWNFVFTYASPNARVNLRSMDIVRPSVKEAFGLKREAARRDLEQGKRRRAMAPVIAAFRLTLRRQLSTLHRCPTYEEVMAKKLPTVPARTSPKANTPPSPRARRIPVSQSAAHPKAVEPHVERKRATPRANHLAAIPAVQQPVVALQPTVQRKLTPSTKQRAAPSACQEAAVSDQSTAPPRMSKILTQFEEEVVWLSVESLLPQKDPKDFDYDFVKEHASAGLKEKFPSRPGRWLPRVVRTHKAEVKSEFQRVCALVLKLLESGYRRPEIAAHVPNGKFAWPEWVRVQLPFHTETPTYAELRYVVEPPKKR